jgi:hypothetical protein
MCDKGTYDSRLIYPEVQAPSQPHGNNCSSYEQVPMYDRITTASSFLTEEDNIVNPQDEIRFDEETDLMRESLSIKKANLSKW